MGAKPKRLGKGLSALLPDFSMEDKERLEQFREIEVDRILPNPYQPREDFDQASLEELKRSISEKGVIQPITVRRYESGYQLIAGERRLRVVKELGYRTIPAFIVDVKSDSELLELALVENIQREDLNPIDLARAYQRLIDECHLTQEQVAQKVGKDRTTITNFLRLLKLPSEIKDSVRTGAISMGHARALLSIEDPELQKRVWRKIIKQGLSVRKVEALVRELSEPKPAPFLPVIRKSPYILQAEEKFREVFGTQVRIHPKKDGGKIEIEYYSQEDLERLLEIVSTLEEKYLKAY